MDIRGDGGSRVGIFGHLEILAPPRGKASPRRRLRLGFDSLDVLSAGTASEVIRKRRAAMQGARERAKFCWQALSRLGWNLRV